MTDKQIHPTGDEPAPAAYVLPDAAEVMLKMARASFDGSLAAVPFVPCLRIVSDAGTVSGEAVADKTVAAGGSADVTWFPHVGAGGSSSSYTPLNEVYYYSDILTVPAAGIVVGVQDCLFGLNTLTSPDIFDPLTLPTVTPTVLTTGRYAFTFHSTYRQGQADHPGFYAQPSIDMADGGDPLSVADNYELRNLLNQSYRGGATVTGVWPVTAGDTIQANIAQTYNVGPLDYNYDLFVERLT